MAITIQFEEKDLEDYLCECGLEYLELKFIARQVKIDKFFIDILAYSKKEKCFYILELKRNLIDSKAFTQAFKYHTLMTYKYNGRHKFKTLLIGENLSEDLFYILSFYNSMPWGENKNNFLYCLFGYDFENGINFNTYNTLQGKIEKYLEETYNV
jgi:hypothetical protein